MQSLLGSADIHPHVCTAACRSEGLRVASPALGGAVTVGGDTGMIPMRKTGQRYVKSLALQHQSDIYRVGQAYLKVVLVMQGPS
jgi:hypothetical protein